MSESAASEVIVRVSLSQHRADYEQLSSQIQVWLAERLGAQDLSVLDVSTPTGTGVANENILVDAAWSIDGVKHSGGFVVRAGSASQTYLTSDPLIHYRMYAELADVPGVPVPKVLGFEDDATLIGVPFFVMERVEGLVPSDVPPYNAQGWLTGLSPEQRHELWRRSVEVLATLHQLDSDRFAFLAEPERGASGLEQNVDYWHDFADWAAQGGNYPVLDAAWSWLQEHLPADPPTALSWGDARIPNVIYQGTEPVAVLDWDLVSLAGPECDLAWWMLMDHCGTSTSGIARLPGLGGRRELVDLWEQLIGRKARDLDYLVVFCAYRLAAVLMRIGHVYAERPEAPPGPEDMRTNNIGLQYLALMLDLPYDQPITVTLDDLEPDDPLRVR